MIDGLRDLKQENQPKNEGGESIFGLFKQDSQGDQYEGLIP
jgi:hypothetical protein